MDAGWDRKEGVTANPTTPGDSNAGSSPSLTGVAGLKSGTNSGSADRHGRARSREGRCAEGSRQDATTGLPPEVGWERANRYARLCPIRAMTGTCGCRSRPRPGRLLAAVWREALRR
jgi:hypothetical protein